MQLFVDIVFSGSSFFLFFTKCTFHSSFKVIYPKYGKHRPDTLPHTLNCMGLSSLFLPKIVCTFQSQNCPFSNCFVIKLFSAMCRKLNFVFVLPIKIWKKTLKTLAKLQKFSLKVSLFNYLMLISILFALASTELWAGNSNFLTDKEKNRRYIKRITFTALMAQSAKIQEGTWFIWVFILLGIHNVGFFFFFFFFFRAPALKKYADMLLHDCSSH